MSVHITFGNHRTATLPLKATEREFGPTILALDVDGLPCLEQSPPPGSHTHQAQVERLP